MTAESNQKTIVVIEDDQDFINLIMLMLSDAGKLVIPAVGGHAGLKAVEDYKPDLILLDLMMADLHGWEVYMRLKSDERYKDIPIIVVTALASRYDRTFATQVAKVHDYITKPFMPSYLRQSVAHALTH